MAVCIVPPVAAVRGAALVTSLRTANVTTSNDDGEQRQTTTMALSGCRKVEVEVLTFKHTLTKNTHTRTQNFGNMSALSR